MSNAVMGQRHPKWDRFLSLLDAGAAECSGSGGDALLRRALAELWEFDIDRSIEYLWWLGGKCPCFVLGNVVRHLEDGVIIDQLEASAAAVRAEFEAEGLA